MAVASSSNPITSVAPSSSPITSVPDSYPPSYQPSQQQLLARLTLEMRGERFVVERETLLNLPESVLLGMFPNGLILSRQQLGWPDEEDDGENQVYPIDFDPASFRYILSFWSQAHTDFYGTSSSPGYFHKQQHLNNNNSSSSNSSAYTGNLNNSDYPAGPGENPLISRQPIIVLREELEYFSIVPSTDPAVNPSSTSNTLPASLTNLAKVGEDGQPTPELLRLKREAGKALVKRTKVFTALQRNVSKEGNLAEQHLIDMLCMSGFARDDDWGYRSLEPTRTVISSIALVLLKTGIHHPESFSSSTNAKLKDEDDGSDSGSDSASEMDTEKDRVGDAQEDLGSRGVTIDQGQMSTAQKLLLFWRKPARKCWWDGVQVDVPLHEGSDEMVSMKVWARRVWTLELSLL